jgi:hypothetical protein
MKTASMRGRLPPDPRPILCTGCYTPPRFRDRVAVACSCGAPPHPLAWLALEVPIGPLSVAELRRTQQR